MVDLNSGEKTGMKAALAAARPQDIPVPGSGGQAQLPLPALCEDEDTGRDAEKELPAGRGRGRPPGARNKSTKEWTDYLLGRYQSPLIALFETFNRPVSSLAEDLGFTKQGTVGRHATPAELLDLFKVQMQAAKEALPYVHQRQPLAIDAGEHGLMQLIINTGASEKQAEEAGQMPVHFLDAEIIENQGFSDEESATSNAMPSNAAEEKQEDQQDKQSGATD